MPEYLHVCGVAYRVVERDMDDCGAIEECTQEIHVRDGMGVEAQTLTIAHELVHAFLMAAGTRDNHDEREVEALARQWAAFMRDERNAWFLERLTAGRV